MLDYSEGKIYKISSPYTKKNYIGSTCKTLKRRLQHHISSDSCSSIEIVKYVDFSIQLIENFPCKNRIELRKREQYYLDLYKDDICNMKNAYTNQIEYHQKYKQKYHRTKKYKEYDRNRKKNLKVINCLCGGHYKIDKEKSHFNTIKHKQWRSTFSNDLEFID